MQGTVQGPTQRAAVLRVPNSPDETQAVTLSGNVHSQARPEFDRGFVNAETRLDRMLLLLKASPAQQSELDALVEAQQNPASPLYHRWLTPAEYGARFGVSAQDMSRVRAWLAGHGFTVIEIPSGNRLVLFSGTAGQVFDTFHTEIHRYRVEGISHIANSLDPQIPVALAGVVSGVVSLSDFRRTSEIKERAVLGAQQATATPGVTGLRGGFGAGPLYSAGSTHYLFPADFAAIYNLNPLYSAGTSGNGSSIAIAGRSNINLSDVVAFRSLSGLVAKTPTVILAGADPELVANDQDESTLDVEWAGAVAPAAAVSLVAAASTSTTDGVDLAAQYIVNHRTAPVVSVSYGSCEQDMGAAELAFYNSLWEQAASEGMSVFVSSGDAGAAGCSVGSAVRGSQTAVNGLCSSPYATCVGGTKFNEGSSPAQYWSSANSAGYGSALGYIPEEAWNESAVNGGSGLWASGGGASVVYPQPAWQAAVIGAGAASGMRGVPDVALSSAGHDGYMVYENGAHWIISGTSAAAPVFAGLMALVVERTGGLGQGSANAELYSLVNAERNPFHATQSGNNSVPGVAGFWANGATYNLATGLGSVDGAALAGIWGSGSGAPPTLKLTAASNMVSVTAGGSATMSFSAVTGGSFAGDIGLSMGGLRPGLTAVWAANPITPTSGESTNAVTLTVMASSLAAQGNYSFMVTAAGDSLVSTQSVTVQVQKQRACFGLLRALRLPCGAPAPVRLQIPKMERSREDQ
jgi:subtilase family serine protease